MTEEIKDKISLELLRYGMHVLFSGISISNHEEEVFILWEGLGTDKKYYEIVLITDTRYRDVPAVVVYRYASKTEVGQVKQPEGYLYKSVKEFYL